MTATSTALPLVRVKPGVAGLTRGVVPLPFFPRAVETVVDGAVMGENRLQSLFADRKRLLGEALDLLAAVVSGGRASVGAVVAGNGIGGYSRDFPFSCGERVVKVDDPWPDTGGDDDRREKLCPAGVAASRGTVCRVVGALCVCAVNGY